MAARKRQGPFQNSAIQFSGGRTSGYMLWRILEANGGALPDGAVVCFENTGKERNETLEFVERVSQEWGVPVTWLEYCRTNDEHDFRLVDFASASRAGEPFDAVLGWTPALPNPVARPCTTQLKVRTMQRFMRSRGLTEWNEVMGIRADERHRTIGIKADCPSYICPQFPLVEGGVSEADVMAFWKAQPFDLQLGQHEGNCDLCFLKARSKIVSIMREKPELARWWLDWEERKSATCTTGSKFREDRSYAGMFIESQQPTLFDHEDDAIPCVCTDGAYKGLDESNGD